MLSKAFRIPSDYTDDLRGDGIDKEFLIFFSLVSSARYCESIALTRLLRFSNTSSNGSTFPALIFSTVSLTFFAKIGSTDFSGNVLSVLPILDFSPKNQFCCALTAISLRFSMAFFLFILRCINKVYCISVSENRSSSVTSCYRSSRCVKCAGDHLTSDCTVPKDTASKCTN